MFGDKRAFKNHNLNRTNVMDYAPRLIHFYDFTIPTTDLYSSEQAIKEVFQLLIRLNEEKSQDRFLKGFGFSTCTRNILFRTSQKIIEGKLLRVRTDVFPELINTVDDVIRDIEASEDDGIVEVTHFLINYTKPSSIIIAFEFNQYGAKVNDFKWYFNHFLKSIGVSQEATTSPIVQDNLQSYITRINRCSLLKAKVHKDNLHRVNEVSDDLFTAFDAALSIGESEYAEITIKFDYRTLPNTPGITQKVQGWIRKFISNKKYVEIFEELSVKAEDAENSYKIELFDLISNKIKSSVNVQKRPKSRSVISADMFEKLEREMIKHRLI